MVELDVVDHRDVRQVVPHLRTLVEVCGVVLVRFDYEILRVREAEGRAEVLRDAADQEGWVEARNLEHPRQDRCRGRLAVRSRHRDRRAAPDELLLYGHRSR